MGLEEVFESPSFWILAGMGISMEVLGYIVGKNMGLDSFPLWQFIILIIGTIVASAVFALKD